MLQELAPSPLRYHHQQLRGPHLPDSEPCYKTPPLYLTTKDIQCSISAWMAVGMSCSLPILGSPPFHCFRKCGSLS